MQYALQIISEISSELILWADDTLKKSTIVISHNLSNLRSLFYRWPFEGK
jgi:hypothetical protein